jgi:hypothetical protein
MGALAGFDDMDAGGIDPAGSEPPSRERRSSLGSLSSTTGNEMPRVSGLLRTHGASGNREHGGEMAPRGRMQTAHEPVNAHRVSPSGKSWRGICCDAKPLGP